MRFLSSERLSPHKHKTSEGYLVCVDAILARTGSQQYRKSEVFADSDDDTIIDVDRTAEEVFSPETLASFENKPITVEHPSENVTAENYNELSVGFVRDVHRGTVDGQEVMLGTLVITDATAIEEIENGEHVELSCGYDCDIVDEAHPQQRNIRGNHVALCEQGRAGIARIVDSVSNKVIGDSVESDFEDITNMSDAKELLKRYGIDLIKKDNRNYVLRKGSKDYTFYVLDNPNEVRKDLIRAVKKLTMNDSKVKDAYVYLFAKSDMKSRDILEAKKYNLEVLGTNRFGSETNLVVKGDLNNLKRFAKEYLAYELHPDYLYKENEFAGSIVKDCEMNDESITYKNYKLVFHSGYNMFINMKDYYEVYSPSGTKVGMQKTLESAKKLVDDRIQRNEDSIKDADKYTFKLSKRKNEYDEYVIKAYKNGKYYEDASYYTDDWDDAIGTLKDLARRQGQTVTQQGSVWVADAKDYETKDAVSSSDRNILINICRRYSGMNKDADLKQFMSDIENQGFDISVSNIDGWKMNKHVPGEQIKIYTFDVSKENKTSHIRVTLYADERTWKVYETNAYVTDSIKNAIFTVNVSNAEDKDISRFITEAQNLGFTTNDKGFTIELLNGNETMLRQLKSKMTTTSIKFNDAVNGKLKDLNVKEFVEKAFSYGNVHTDRSNNKGDIDYIIFIDPYENGSAWLDVIEEKYNNDYDADDFRHYNKIQTRIVSKKLNNKESLIKEIETVKNRFKDSERKFEFSYEDGDTTHLHVVKASSLEDAINKFKRRK